MLRPRNSGGSANVFTIAPTARFAATLTQGLLARIGGDALALADVTVYLPTQRAVRSLREMFARAAGGASLLPDFRALGDADEDELLLSEDPLDLPPAMPSLRRRLLLASLIRRWSHTRDGGTMRFAQAASLAKSLARVMDEAETQGADLSRIKDLAPENLAEHWAEVRDFLAIIPQVWAPLLAEEGRLNPADHRGRALQGVAERLEKFPPHGFVLAAGSTGSIPATAALLSVIARLPNGAVVLPGLDRDLDADSWERLDPSHPQYGLKQLLERMGVRRDQVRDWSEAAGLAGREELLREVLRPAPTTDAWRALAERVAPLSLGGLSLFEAADQNEEAAVIALLLRETLETPDRTAALVTLDRGLARRVAAAMKRWDIAIDDSAGRALSRMPAGTLLSLLAEAAESGFAPVPLLALLKHPLVSLGDDKAGFRTAARALDTALRGPRPDSGLSGIAKALRDKPQALQAWFASLREALSPLEAAMSAAEMPLDGLLDTHVAVAEAVAPEIWSGADGQKARQLVLDLKEAAGGLGDIETASYPALLRALMDEVAVRPAYGLHPRLAILGPLEARLQSFDRVILGGLNEGVWPASAPDDPWFSRPMRRALGLEQPERHIGLSAHDFAGLAAAPEVILTRAAKADGTPMVASRWVQRLQQLTKGLGIEKTLALDPRYAAYAEALADPGKTAPVPPPYPCPPVEARPRSLSVTDAERWVRDPYALYAKKILGLKKLDPLDAPIDARQRGSTLHSILERYIQRHPDPGQEALRHLVLIVDEVLEEAGFPQATLALWRPRFLKAAEWFVDLERARRPLIQTSHVEVKGTLRFPAPAGEFELHGIADRIDVLRAGGGTIIDYKTGAPPSPKQVATHLSPQLSLEGAMLAAGGFEGVAAMTPAQLVYIQIGGTTPEYKPVSGEASALAVEALEKLTRRVALFDEETTGYSSRVAPARADAAGDFDHLARVREWSLSGWNSGDEE